MKPLKQPLKIKNHQTRNIIIAVWITACLSFGAGIHVSCHAIIRQMNGWMYNALHQIKENPPEIVLSETELARIETIDDLTILARDKFCEGEVEVIRRYQADPFKFNLQRALVELLK